jgi:hypothetical protein
MITLEIPELPPSLNVTRKGHWSTRHKRRKRWSMLVLVAKSEAKLFHVKPFPSARVTIERHGGKALDHDNFAGGAKDLVDGLRDNGLIVNDDPEHLELRFEQYPGSRIPKRTVVSIEART